MAISHYIIYVIVCAQRDDVEFFISAERWNNIFFFVFFLRLAITDSCRDTDDTDEYVLGEIDEYELDYTSASEDLFSNGSSSGTDVINKKKQLEILFQKNKAKKIQTKKL